MIGALIGYILTEVFFFFSRHHLPFLFIGFSEVLSLNLPILLKDPADFLSSKQMQVLKGSTNLYCKSKVQRDRGKEEELR